MASRLTPTSASSSRQPRLNDAAEEIMLGAALAPTESMNSVDTALCSGSKTYIPSDLTDALQPSLVEAYSMMGT